MDAAKIARENHKSSGGVLEATLAHKDCLAAYNKSFLLLQQLSVFIEAISARRESQVLSMALKEYQFGQFALCLGLYRQAFSALRLSFELALGAVDFSSQEMKLRVWLKGESDMNWNSLVSKESGVLSKNFVKAFCEDMADHANTYQSMAERVYRECSEFVHGNADTHRSLPEEIKFSPEVVLLWCAKADTILLVIAFAFSSRYLSDLNVEQLERMKPILLDTLGHIEGIRSRLGGAVGG